jgi:hypothetical protein
MVEVPANSDVRVMAGRLVCCDELTGDGRPLAGAVNEAKVDIGIVLQLVGLVGLGVGEEEEINAARLLHGVSGN